MTSTAYEPKCDKCGATSKDLFAVAGGEFLCEKCAFEDAKQKAKWGAVDSSKDKLTYPTELWTTSDPDVKALLIIAERIEVTNELLLRLIKKVENVL